MLIRDIDEAVAKAFARCGYRRYEELMAARAPTVHGCLVEQLGNTAPTALAKAIDPPETTEE